MGDVCRNRAYLAKPVNALQQVVARLNCHDAMFPAGGGFDGNSVPTNDDAEVGLDFAVYGITTCQFDKDTPSLVGDHQPLAMRIVLAIGALGRLDALRLSAAKPALRHAPIASG